MRIHIIDTPEEVIEEYNVLQYVNEDGYVYCEIIGAMYGLAQAVQITHLDLVKHHEPHGYFPSKQTPRLWFHKTKPIALTLVVDDFGIKYIDKEHINHLLKVVEEQYPVKVDWTGRKYIPTDVLLTLFQEYKHINNNECSSIDYKEIYYTDLNFLSTPWLRKRLLPFQLLLLIMICLLV